MNFSKFQIDGLSGSGFNFNSAFCLKKKIKHTQTKRHTDMKQLIISNKELKVTIDCYLRSLFKNNEYFVFESKPQAVATRIISNDKNIIPFSTESTKHNFN